MPPSRGETDRQSIHKSYHLRFSKWNPSIFSSELSSIRKTACQAGALSVDIKQLRRELAAVKREQTKAFTERDNVTAAHQGLLQAVKAALQCPVCKKEIEKPFTARLSYRPEAILPENLRNHDTPFTDAEIETLCDGQDSVLPGRYYHCPTCRAFINDPPAEIPLLRDVTAKIVDLLTPDVRRANQGVPADPAGLWGVFFKS
ncbi:uncharacterized protein F5891DRAFT_1183787 [Suillus fuscotomentosus]|uniref:Uncharacterized protein n=1 Tax=Suillus fuscotomentosus TaxID=1912939 RepID=A0AAD4HQQ7_9AGAM|nr:uncharacterized protein F5891DRAFT_1183787 [Suillus fuscotomentosus]KAG1905081.1 hypothetical protein F5891DRAFT_1183787 [Suillus fuscotomentosus]